MSLESRSTSPLWVGNPLEMIMGLCRLLIDTNCRVAYDHAFDRTFFRSFKDIWTSLFHTWCRHCHSPLFMSCADQTVCCTISSGYPTWQGWSSTWKPVTWAGRRRGMVVVNWVILWFTKETWMLSWTSVPQSRFFTTDVLYGGIGVGAWALISERIDQTGLDHRALLYLFACLYQGSLIFSSIYHRSIDSSLIDRSIDLSIDLSSYIHIDVHIYIYIHIQYFPNV